MASVNTKQIWQIYVKCESTQNWWHKCYTTNHKQTIHVFYRTQTLNDRSQTISRHSIGYKIGHVLSQVLLAILMFIYFILFHQMTSFEMADEISINFARLCFCTLYTCRWVSNWSLEYMSHYESRKPFLCWGETHRTYISFTNYHPRLFRHYVEIGGDDNRAASLGTFINWEETLLHWD